MPIDQSVQGFGVFNSPDIGLYFNPEGSYSIDASIFRVNFSIGSDGLNTYGSENNYDFENFEIEFSSSPRTKRGAPSKLPAWGKFSSLR